MLFTITSYDTTGYIAKVTSYNGCNIKGFYLHRNTSSGYLTLYLKLSGYTSAWCDVYSTLDVNSCSVVSNPGLTFVEVSSKTIYTDFSINGTISNATNATNIPVN